VQINKTFLFCHVFWCISSLNSYGKSIYLSSLLMNVFIIWFGFFSAYQYYFTLYCVLILPISLSCLGINITILAVIFNHALFPFIMLQDALTLVFIQISNCKAADFVIISTKHQYSEIIISAGSQPCSWSSHRYTTSLPLQIILALRNMTFLVSVFQPGQISLSCLAPGPWPCVAFSLYPLLCKIFYLQFCFR